MLAFVANLYVNESPQAARDFVLQVNAHIAALEAWERHEAAIRRETALHGTPEPRRPDCDCEAAYRTALQAWREAQHRCHRPYPAPSAPIAVERSIQVHTGADGSRRFFYRSDDWGDTVFRNREIQEAKTWPAT
jgi:hypothetical protein